MKYILTLVFVSSLFISNAMAQKGGDDSINRQFALETDGARQKYESDHSIYFNIHIENMPDSIYRKNIDKFTWDVVGLPAGASFNKFSRTFKWEKFFINSGTTNLKFKLSSPYCTKEINVSFEVEEEWAAFFIPGVSYTMFTPQDKEKFGEFHGFSIEYLIYSGIHRNENKGPSHIKVYAKFDLMSSTKNDVTEAFNYSAGINLSFERNPKRRFLIPFFGLDIGYIYQKEMGNIFCFTPTAGVWLYSDPNIMAHATVGYLYPSESIETYRGLRASAGLNFSMW